MNARKFDSHINRTVLVIGIFTLLGILPRVALAGLYTIPFNPTYNVGAEAAYMNPAGMTGVKTYAAAAGVGGLIYDAEIDVAIAGAGLP